LAQCQVYTFELRSQETKQLYLFWSIHDEHVEPRQTSFRVRCPARG